MANENGGKKEREKRILLRPASIISIIFLSVTAVALAYIAGVMSGRHGSFGKTGQPETAPGPVAVIEEKEPEKVLAPEELDFARILKEQGARPKPEAAMAKAQEETEKGEATDPEAPANEQGVEANNQVLFDFVYQIAAFREESGADNLRQKLEGDGFRTILQKSGKVFVVLVRMRGTESRATELRDVAQRLGLGEPLLKQKRPVSP